MFSRIFTLLLLLVALKATAQRDLIITQAGEQIRCRIVDESSMRFSYIYVNDKGRPVRTEIFKTLISSFKYNYFPDDMPSGKKDIASGKKGTPAAGAPAAGTPAASERKEVSARPESESKKTNVPEKKEVAARPESESKKTNAPDKKEVAGKPDKDTKTGGSEKKEAVVTEGDKPVTAYVDNKKEVPGKTTDVPGSTSPGKVPAKDSAAQKYVSPLKGKTEFTNYLKYRIGFKGGLGNIIDENTDKSPFGLFNEKLRRGWVYGVDAAVFLNDHIGIGITYQSYQSRNKNVSLNSEVPLESGGSLPIRSLESKVNHKFVGPTLLGRLGMDYKTFIVATVSPGYYFYSDKGMVNQMNYEYKGGAWGGAATLGIDFLMGNNETGRDVILSFECGYNYGQLKSLKPENGWNKLPIGLNRLDFAVGLRFTRFPRYLR